MLSDEEKEIFKNLKEYMQNNINNGYHKFIYNDLDWDFKCIDCINAIDKVLKQSKEIEELKQIKCKLDEKNIPIETLLAEFERLEDLEDDLTTVYLNGVYDGVKKVEDKIKAKIEEQDETKQYWTDEVKDILKSLLRKE